MATRPQGTNAQRKSFFGGNRLDTPLEGRGAGDLDVRLWKMREQALKRGVADTRVYEFLHIDDLEGGLAHERSWVPNGFRMFSRLRSIRDRAGIEDPVVLAFSLRSGRKLRGPFVKTISGLQDQLGYVPPELGWILPRGAVQDPRSRGISVKIDDAPTDAAAFFIEELARDGNTTIAVRALWFVA